MSNFELSGLMSAYKDYARAYLFKCRINNFGDPDFEYLVKTTKLPESNISEIETDWQGNKYKIGGTAEVGDFTISFNMDPLGDLRLAFVHWSEEIHNPKTNEHGIPGDVTIEGYFRNIILEHLDGAGNVILMYEMVGAWPKAIGDVALDYASKEVATFDVTFAYQYHLMERKTPIRTISSNNNVIETGTSGR